MVLPLLPVTGDVAEVGTVCTTVEVAADSL